MVKREALRTVEKRGSRWLWSFFSTKHFYWLLAVYFLPMMTIQVIISSVSTALFNATILFLLMVTAQIAINLENVQSRIEYLSLFQYFNKTGDQLHMPNQSSKSNVAHYITFVCGLLLGMIFLGFSNHSFVYYELLAAVSMVIAFFVVLEFDLYESPFFWLCVLAKFPSWLVLFVEKSASFVGLSHLKLLDFCKQPLWSIAFFEEFSLNVNAIALLQVALHLIVLAVTTRYWKVPLQSLGPHLLFFGWFVLARHFLSNSSSDLIAISTSLLLLSFYSIAIFASPLYFLWLYGLTPPFFYSIAFIALMAALAALIMFLYKYKRSWWLHLSIEYVVLLCLAVFLALLLFGSGWYASIYQVPHPLPSVSLDQYGRYCGPGNWEGWNSVQTQVDCIHLQGRVLKGRAKIRSVGISKVQDSMAESIRFLPYVLERALTCYFGESEPMCGHRADMDTCIPTGCHFHHSLTYSFKIELALFTGVEESVKATILVSHRYKDFVLKLRSGDFLQFEAAFVEGMGSDHVTLQAHSLSVSGVADTRKLEREEEMEMKKSMWAIFVRSVKDSLALMLEIFFGYV